MEIKIGKYFENKTWKYLLPVLRGHGNEFIMRFNTVFKLAVGIHDSLLDGSTISEGRQIYLMLDKRVSREDYEIFIDWIRQQDYYVADYCPDSDIHNTRKHMVVVKIPERFNDAYDSFLRGQYSQMYTDDEIKILFPLPLKKDIVSVLLRKSEAVNTFIKTAEIEFETKLEWKRFRTKEDEDSYKFFISRELDLPLKIEEEIFNIRDSERTFFNEKLDKTWLTKS